MPWKNGGGSTIEVAVGPDNADLAQFDWRISMARVEQDGPFSLFPEVDRTLCVLDGDGVVLHGPRPAPTPVTPASDPFLFPGDVPVHCTLLGSAILDLNVMTRRGRFRHRVKTLPEGTHALGPEAGTVFLVATGHTRLEVDGRGSVVLDAYDVARIEGGSPVAVEGRGNCFLITLQAGA